MHSLGMHLSSITAARVAKYTIRKINTGHPSCLVTTGFDGGMGSRPTTCLTANTPLLFLRSGASPSGIQSLERSQIFGFSHFRILRFYHFTIFLRQRFWDIGRYDLPERELATSVHH